MANEEELLQAELQWLSKNLGVRRLNLNKAMRRHCPTLWRVWHLSTEDPPEEVWAKVTLYLEQLIGSQLQYAGRDEQEREKYYKHRIVARGSYNIDRDMPDEERRKYLGPRRGWMAERHSGLELSPRTGERSLDRDIIPKFASSLARNPPSPFPPDEIKAFIQRNGDLVPASVLEGEEPTKEQPPKLQAIIDLLRAQTVASKLPYWPFDPDMPKLRDVYIELSLRSRGTNRRSSDSNATSLDEALDLHRHLLITGGPGVGKSTLAIQTVARLSEKILDVGPSTENPAWIPVYIPACYLLGTGGFNQTIVTALNRHLGLRLTNSLQESMLSKEHSDDQGWLIFTDGMDEIIDTNERQRLIGQIADRHLNDPRFRFVFLSRSLGDGQLKSLQQPSVGRYEVAPFNRSQLEAFAEAWFGDYYEEQNFLGEADHSGLAHVIESPLLATIAASLYEKNESSFPTTVIDLYEEFIRSFLYDRQDRVEALERLTVRFKTLAGSSGVELADQLYTHRRDLCAYIAYRMLDGDKRPFAAIGTEWMRRTFARMPENIPGWKQHFESVLIDTGLVVSFGADLAFIHRTIAEYLAASLAGLPFAGHPHLGAIENFRFWYYGNDYSEQYIDFRILAWARDHDATPLALQLLRHADEYESRDRLDKLGQLITYGLPLDFKAMEKYVEYFMTVHRESRLGVPQHWYYEPEGDIERITSYSFDMGYIRLLDILVSRYPKLAERLLADEYDKYLEPDIRATGLAFLWREGRRQFIEEHLAKLMAKENQKWQIAVAQFYDEVGKCDKAIDILLDLLIKERDLPELGWNILGLNDMTEFAIELLDDLDDDDMLR